jgi:hypothetical protein
METPVLGKEALNTHFFDGKLEEMIQTHLFKDIERVKHYTKEKIKCIPVSSAKKRIYSCGSKFSTYYHPNLRTQRKRRRQLR